MTEELFPRFSQVEMTRRWQLVRDAMARQGLDVLLVAGSSARWNEKNANIRYLSEFADMEAVCAYLVIPREGEPTLLLWGDVRIDNARLITSVADLRQGYPGYVDVLAERVRELGLAQGVIGIETCDPYIGIPANHRDGLTRGLPGFALRSVTGLVGRLRLRKSEDELACIRRAAALADDALRHLGRNLRPGMRDYEVAAEIDYALTRRGGDPPYLTLVGSTSMSDPQIPFPLIAPSRRRISAGDAVLVEVTARYAGYWAQVQRTFTVGEPTSLYRRLQDAANQVFDATLARLTPGAPATDLLAGDTLLASAGFRRVAMLAHGLGMEAPELPLVGSGRWPIGVEHIEAGMCFAVQPNPVTPDRRAGVFCGNTVFLSESGPQVLGEFPRDLIVVKGS